MRAPRWLKDFSEWRWAPFIALFGAALAFVALALLLIPTRFESTSRDAFAARSFEPGRVAEPVQAPFATSPSVQARDVVQVVTPPSVPPPASEPVPAPAAAETAPNRPDFVAHMADRADRPGR